MHELAPTSFFKPRMGTYENLKNKAEVLNRKCHWKEVIQLHSTEQKQMIVIDFMGYAKKVPVKKLKKLKSFHDLVTRLWLTSKNLLAIWTQTDVVFDLYKENSIKSQEQDQHNNRVKGIATEIYW